LYFIYSYLQKETEPQHNCCKPIQTLLTAASQNVRG